MTVCVVGAGIAGAACARALHAAGVPVRVRERSQAVGGRMATRSLAGRPVDLGASYLVARDPAFRAVVDDWAARGLATPWTDTFAVLPERRPTTGPVRWGAPGGLRTLVADLVAGLDVQTGRPVQQVGPGPVVDGEPYDAVVLAMPDPQALRLLHPALAEERSALEGRPWQPVLALAAGFPSRTWDLDGAFVSGDPALDWVADDGRRRGDGAPVLVAHSSADLAARCLDEPEAAVPELVAALRRLLALPEPVWTHLHRWSYAKPEGVREQAYLLGAARVGVCGDGWGASKVEAAWLSGHRLGLRLAGLPGSGQR